MKMRIALLALVGVGSMAAGAFAQVIVYERHGKHSSFGIGLSFGHSRYAQPTYVYAPAPVVTYYTPGSYYVPAYGYHTHHADSHVTPYGGHTTTYDHFGPLHAPSQTTTYYGYGAPCYTRRTYYW